MKVDRSILLDKCVVPDTVKEWSCSHEIRAVRE